MSRICWSGLFFCLLFAICCYQKKSEITTTSDKQQTINVSDSSLGKGVVIEDVVNRFDTLQSFCLFIPLNAASSGKTILFFDPKGNGAQPVKRYQRLAEKFGIILAGSNNSRNGLKPEQSAAIAKNFVNDIISRLNLKRQNITACGFSGGARVAVQTAIRENLSGVIGCGAGFPNQPDRNYGFTFIGMVGNEDFNYLEMKRLDRVLKAAGINHKIIVLNGGHEWPSAEELELAWLCMEAFKDGREIAGDTAIEKLLEKTSASLPGSFAESEADRQELAQQSEIAQAFSKQEFGWLEDKIKKLLSGNNKKSHEQALSDKRLLNFISLMGFLYSEKALSIDLHTAKKYLDIYGKADPDNPDYHELMQLYARSIRQTNGQP